MWFFPRNSPIVVLAIVTGVILMFASGLDEVAYVLGGIVAAYLFLGMVFDRYEGPKR